MLNHPQVPQQPICINLRKALSGNCGKISTESHSPPGGKLAISSCSGRSFAPARAPTGRATCYWQPKLTTTLLNGLMLVSEKATLMLSPPATENVCVLSWQLDPLLFVVTEQDIAVAAPFL